MNPPARGDPEAPGPPGRDRPPINPPGFLATQDLKDRGWTPALITRFLGDHDRTRPNGLKMGRRRLPPVKLYEEARVLEAERRDDFLAAQARAADARDRAARARETRESRRALLLETAAQSYAPVIHPQPLRRGSVRKARGPYLPALEQTLDRLGREIGRLTERERVRLEELLRERLDLALAAAYDWYPRPGAAAEAGPKRGSGQATPSDWREWDWD